MKKSIISALVILLITTVAYAGKDKTTLKEKVEKSKTVKVFFNVKSEIVDAEDERKLQLIDKAKHTSIKTAMPNEFASKEIKDQVIKILNEGLQVGSVFVEGDISTLPESTKKATKYRDLSKLEDGLYAMVSITGEYTRFLQQKDVDGKTAFESSNRMEIKSHLFFYEVIAGKVKKYGDMMMKSGVLLGHAKTATKKTDKLESLEYMESNFPALPLLDEFKKIMLEYTTDFTKRKLNKHNKVVSKRK